MIIFDNLTVGYQQRTVLSDLNGSIQKGEMIALMGINGVGKSCFLKTLTGLVPKISGSVTIDNRDSSEYTAVEMARNLAVVLTDKIQVDFLRVHEFISLGRSPHTNFWGELTEEDKKVTEETVELLNINSIMDKYFSDLSDGQKQKVQLARALVQSPAYLFLDEPTTYLDIPSKIELMKILKVVSEKKQMGVVFSTHDWSLIEKVVDYVWLVDLEGRLHKKSPEEMSHSGLLFKNFGI